jgi:hypothetical protein
MRRIFAFFLLACMLVAFQRCHATALPICGAMPPPITAMGVQP